MFNLLISGAGWQPNRDNMPRGRVLEHTRDDVQQHYKPNGDLFLEGLYNLPALFASESSHGDPARVGRVTRVRTVGINYEIDYTVDPDIPPIPDAKLQEMSRALDITAWEFNRTHWAVKDVDLFEVLLKNGLGTRPKPKVFDLSEGVQANLVAVMMPFDAGIRPTYEALQDAAAATDMQCQRADDIWENERIIQDVVTLICRARVVICDLTGRNSNVFYEMGIAHSLGKDIIMITQNPADVPFDVAHIRYIRYLPNDQGRSDLTTEVARRLQTLTA